MLPEAAHPAQRDWASGAGRPRGGVRVGAQVLAPCPARPALGAREHARAQTHLVIPERLHNLGDVEQDGVLWGGTAVTPGRWSQEPT